MKRFIAIFMLLVPALCVAATKEIKTVTFKSNLHCENCVKKVVENISFVKGVKDLDVSLERQEIVVKYDAAKTDVKTLAKEINDLGYKAVEKQKEIARQEIAAPVKR
ncbi:MAG: heavy-metal-associated domain-containing protein [Bacteroidales bacterium]|nr:heavy-metal-associated domain-containing protein [Bacteroidales bacterium]